MANLTSSLTVKLIDDVSKPARTIDQALEQAARSAQAVAKAMASTGSTDRFAASLAKLRVSAKDIDAVSRAWKDYSSSAKLAGNAADWTKAQAAGVRRWESQTISALRAVQREQAKFNRAPSPGTHSAIPGGHGGRFSVAAPIATVVTAHKAAEVSKDVIEKYAAADKTLRYQGAMADLSPAEMASRYNQAVTLGPQKGLKPEDILHAQQTLAGRGVKKEFVEPFTGEIAEYARAMKTDMASAAKTLETIVFSTNQHVDNAGEASSVMRRQIDMAVKAAKVGGLDDHAIQLGSKMGAAAGHAGGFKNETIFGIMSALSRAGYSGEEAGTATRGIVSKLVSPTRQGLDALDAMGVNYNDFTKMSGGMTPDGLDPMMKRRFGKGLNADQRERLQSIMGNADVLGNRDDFIAQVSEVLKDSFQKDKKGNTKAQDATKIAKFAGDFYKLGTESVNVEGLLMAILEKHPALQLLNKMFTTEHGSKVSAMADNVGRFKEIIDAITHVPDGFAKQIGDKTMGGVAGSLATLAAQADATALSFGKANEALIQYGADAASKGLKAGQDLPDPAKRTAVIAGGVAVAGATAASILSWFAGGTLTTALKAGLSVAGKTTLPTLIASAAIEYLSSLLIEGGKSGKGIAHGGAPEPGKKLDPSDELPGVPQVETKAIDESKTKADEAKAALEGLNLTVTPNVELGPIDTAIAKARALLSALGAIQGAASQAEAAVAGIKPPPSLGTMSRGSFSPSGDPGR